MDIIFEISESIYYMYKRAFVLSRSHVSVKSLITVGLLYEELQYDKNQQDSINPTLSTIKKYLIVLILQFLFK